MVGVPGNAMGFQFAHSGIAYAGFFLFSHDQYREYLQTPLVQTLEKGKTYFISMYVSLANHSQAYIDRMGFTFLPNEKHYATADVLDELDEIAPVYLDLQKLGSDTAKWHQLTGKYKAKGTEKFLIIGSFQVGKIKRGKFVFPKNMKSPINRNSHRDAYYYIDDVSLVEWINPPQEPVKDTALQLGKDTVTAEKPKTLKNVQFKTGSSVLEKSSFAELDELAVVLLKSELTNIEISGHTDNSGDPAANLKLSADRAREVAKYLAKKGVNKKRLSCVGYGDTRPLVDNDTEENKAINRRVEIVLAE